MKKILLCAVLMVLLISAFALFAFTINGLCELINWGRGLHNVVLCVPATFVVLCYTQGAMWLLRKVWAESEYVFMY